MEDKDIFFLLNLMCSYSFLWKCIGLGLGFKPGELDNIQGDVQLLHGAPKSYMQELLSQWCQWPVREHSELPTLRRLCDTLRSTVVGLGQLAVQVEMEFEAHKLNRGKLACQCTTIE